MEAPFNVLVPILWTIIGLCFGSFSNVLIYRLANDVPMSMKSRSICPKCKHEIKWYDNIPLISYIILGGKCRHCKEKISIRYPLVELSGLLIFMGCYFFFNYGCLTETFGTFNFDYRFIFYSFILLDLLVMSCIDFQIKEIPLSLQLVMFICVGGYYLTKCLVDSNFYYQNLIGLAIPLVLLGGIYLICTLIFKIEPIGLGDVILYMQMGLLLGISNFILCLAVSCIIASVVELIKIKVTKKKDTIPFAPYISIAAALCIFFGEFVINWYFSLLGLEITF